MKFSLVIATRNDGAQISSSLKRLRQISQSSPLEIIVADGASDDKTAELARDWADHVLVLDEPNRGRQMDEGVKKATGDLLFFLSADAQPPGNWQQVLEHFWLAPRQESVAATAFSVDYGSSLALRLASRLSNAAVKWRGAASAEHGLCTTPEIYRESGGFPPLPIREDLVFCQRLGQLGKIVLLEERIWPAGRRLRRRGPLLSALQDSCLTLRFKLGAKPEDLWRGDAGL